MKPVQKPKFKKPNPIEAEFFYSFNGMREVGSYLDMILKPDI